MATTSTAVRTLYVLVPPSPLFAAHWSLFLPDRHDSAQQSAQQAETTNGRRIHVSGDRLNGFTLEIVRGYDVNKHQAVSSRQYSIGSIGEQHLRTQDSMQGENANRVWKDEDEGGGYIDNQPLDDFEQVCVGVKAPGPSLNRVSECCVKGKPTYKTETKDCQWWIWEVVKALTRQGILEFVSHGEENASTTPTQRLEAVPKH